MNIRYPAIIEHQDDGGFTVSFPDLYEAITEGDSMEEALFNAADVLTLTLESRIDDGMDIPMPSIIDRAYCVAPSSKVQAALLVRFCRGERSLSDLARSLETSWPSASRIEDPHHWPSLKQLDRAASAFGKRLVLSFE
ncbi:MAG: type II toxin-antitoxin system HicB family antitoxin [Deltaproteobacteria bacterium]|nr:type II toxin-antitoxin system HicB family antitoxin [Deltaproteobacteria bacterium]